MSSKKTPQHVAIICDGNRRWARSKGLPDFEGHRKGLDTMIQLTKDSRKVGVKYITFWFFSTENWTRSKEEVGYLMNLALTKIDKVAKDVLDDGVRFTHLGRKDRIPAKLAQKFSDLEEKTKEYSEYFVNIAFDYGGRDDIVTAIKNIVKDGLSPNDITEKVVSNHLYTKDIPDPDLIIRTAGEQRLSGYLTWQSVYSELHFPHVTCPDFDINELNKAIGWYRGRDRRYGGDTETQDKEFKKKTLSEKEIAKRLEEDK